MAYVSLDEKASGVLYTLYSDYYQCINETHLLSCDKSLSKNQWDREESENSKLLNPS